MQLKEEVKTLIARAEAADREAIPDGMSIPAETDRREALLEAIAQAKNKIAERTAQRHIAEWEQFEARQTKRQAQQWQLVAVVVTPYQPVAIYRMLLIAKYRLAAFPNPACFAIHTRLGKLQ